MSNNPKPINRIALISDLHLDFWAKYDQTDPVQLFNKILNKCRNANTDKIVIAGDMSNHGNIVVPWINDEIVFVPGNHDFYGYDLPEQFAFAEDETFFATTLWTNFYGANGADAVIYKEIADAYHIRNTSAAKVKALCEQSIDAIVKANKSVVVTHWPPSQHSTAQRFYGDRYNPYFVNNFDNQIAYETEIRLWMCGHVHHRHTYNIGDCLVACNPLGYPGETYREFDVYRPMILEQSEGTWKEKSNE